MKFGNRVYKPQVYYSCAITDGINEINKYQFLTREEAEQFTRDWKTPILSAWRFLSITPIREELILDNDQNDSTSNE